MTSTGTNQIIQQIQTLQIGKIKNLNSNKLQIRKSQIHFLKLIAASALSNTLTPKSMQYTISAIHKHYALGKVIF